MIKSALSLKVKIAGSGANPPKAEPSGHKPPSVPFGNSALIQYQQADTAVRPAGLPPTAY